MATTKPLESFTLFSRLPPELRLRIWELNLPTSRIVPLRCGSDITSPPTSSTHSSPEKALLDAGCTSPAAIPANLHTCVESRLQALSRLSLTFSYARQQPHVFFNPRTDVLYFGPRDEGGYMAANAQFHTAMSLLHPADLAAVRRIAIDDALFRPFSSSSSSTITASVFNYHSSLAVGLTVDCLRQLHRRMPNLQEILFVPPPPSPLSPTLDNSDQEQRGEDQALLLLQQDALLARDTLAYQIQTAMRDFTDHLVATGRDPWHVPHWSVLPSSFSTDPSLLVGVY